MALAFLGAGGNKLFGTMPDGVAMARGLTVFIGVAEVAGALGLILPGVTRIAPQLVGWAAVGLTTIMVLAVGFHAMEGEVGVPALVLGAVCAFIAWGRMKRAPIRGR